MSVEAGKYGRVILPKHIRDKYGVAEGCRLLITELEGRIVLVPVRVYDHPTEALYGSVEPSEPIEDPKSFGREYVRKKLAGDIRIVYEVLWAQRTILIHYVGPREKAYQR